MKKHILFILVLISAGWAKAQLTDTENYVSAVTCLDADCVKKAWSVQYFDGLGRLKQIVNVKASPTEKDIVTHIEYDEFGRQVKDYLPVPQSSSTSGAIYGDPLSNVTSTPYGTEKIYSEKVLESSPLDRILQQKQPGNDWSNNPVKFAYLTNKANNVLKFTTTTGTQNGAFYISELKADGYYPAATLYKNRILDEDGNISYEFKNGEGQTLMVRKVLGNSGELDEEQGVAAPITQYADTYYVYNAYNHLVYVIPPLASAEFKANPNQTISNPDADDTLNNLCYQYRYDGRSRLVEKKLPGKGWEYMVYDKADRLILTQDANLEAEGQWLLTKYDKFGRVVYTGIATGDDRAAMQGAIENVVVTEERDDNTGFTKNGATIYYTNNHYNNLDTILSVNYYDTYPSGTPFPSGDEIFDEPVLTQSYDSQSRSVKSLPVASFVKNIGEDKWTKSYTFYDTKARPVGTHSQNHFGGSTVVYSELDFSGVPVKTETLHKRIDTEIPVHIVENFEYDKQNRLEKHYHEVVGKTPQILLTENTYNEIGQLTNKKVGDNTEEVNYSYNIRGWMTGINLSNTSEIDNSRLFSYKIKYNTPLNTTLKKYNGNIAEVDWVYQSESTQRYEYSYDELNRLQKANYKTIGQTTTTDSKFYNEQLTYDLNGNMLTLKRNAKPNTGQTAVLVDDLAYEYNGNQVMSITDDSGNSSGYPGGGQTISYDDNGNMLTMPDKGISAIEYNYLNLPQQITQNANVTEYLYRADGVKLHKKFTISGQDIDTDYLDGFVYTIPYTEEIDTVLRENPDAALAGQIDAFELGERGIGGGPGNPQHPTATPSFFPTAEGFYDYENSQYIYQYKDHLGNVRLSYVSNEGSAEALSSNDYYPFGLNFINLAPRFGGSVYNPVVTYEAYKYNGKELQETGMYDYGARFLMPDIGRWGVMDGKGELYLSKSPYSYANNTPVNAIDPDGNLVIFINGQHGGSGGSSEYWKGRFRGYMSVAGGQPTAMYDRFDISVSRQLGDYNRKYVDGAMGGWKNTLFATENVNTSATNRINSGFAQGKKDAAEIIKNLARDETTGAIVETIKIITHSMGGAYGKGYVKALKEYISTLPKDQQSQIKITLVADFDPFQAGSFSADSNTKTQQFMHANFWYWNPFAMGWLANEAEQGAEQVKSADGDSPAHSITSFFSDISNLQEGTYKWNGSKWVCTNCQNN